MAQCRQLGAPKWPGAGMFVRQEQKSISADTPSQECSRLHGRRRDKRAAATTRAAWGLKLHKPHNKLARAAPTKHRTSSPSYHRVAHDVVVVPPGTAATCRHCLGREWAKPINLNRFWNQVFDLERCGNERWELQESKTHVSSLLWQLHNRGRGWLVSYFCCRSIL